ADTPDRLEPIVKVRERTVKVEKEAKGSSQPVRVVNLGGTTAPQQSDDDSVEHGPESYEDEDHEFEDHESEDQEDHEDESGDD
ncbi:MAG TPA: hypothetical protein VFZ96_03180, partial [Actinomycetota bacterium]|nr:hypothetical protein [Actinomycetota bacterium]